MTRIIVGVDESERSQDAVALAARLARGTGAELLIACAYPYETVPGRFGGTQFVRYLREDAEAAVARARGGVPGAAGAATRTLESSSPPKALQTLAEEEGAALIVIGSSHRGTVGRVLAGTTAERLLHGAPCPVAVPPKGYRDGPDAGLHMIAAAWDGSAEADAALAAAALLARSAGANLRIVEVLDAIWMGTPTATTGPGYITPPSDVEQKARERLERLAESMDAEPVLVVGDPERELAGESGAADLMVCGSRGYGPHRAVLVGSVSGRLVRDSACPVIVVPRGVQAPLEELYGAAAGVA